MGRRTGSRRTAARQKIARLLAGEMQPCNATAVREVAVVQYGKYGEEHLQPRARWILGVSLHPCWQSCLEQHGKSECRLLRGAA